MGAAVRVEDHGRRTVSAEHQGHREGLLNEVCAHVVVDGFAGDDLPVRAQVGQDPGGAVDLVGIAVEKATFCSMCTRRGDAGDGGLPAQA